MSENLKIFAQFDNNGHVIAFLHEGINIIPQDAHELTQEQYIDLLDNQHHRRFIDGRIETYEPINLIDWDRIRAIRNSKLGASDWTVLIDSPLSAEIKQLWINYRQKLRDITEEYESPDQVIWPIEPV